MSRSLSQSTASARMLSSCLFTSRSLGVPNQMILIFYTPALDSSRQKARIEKTPPPPNCHVTPVSIWSHTFLPKPKDLNA